MHNFVFYIIERADRTFHLAHLRQASLRVRAHSQLTITLFGSPGVLQIQLSEKLDSSEFQVGTQNSFRRFICLKDWMWRFCRGRATSVVPSYKMNESFVVTLSMTQCTLGCSDAKLTALRRDFDTHDVLRECLPLDSHFLHRLLSLLLLFGCCSDPKRVFSVCCAWVALAGGGIQTKRADAHVLILLSPEVAS